MEQKQQEQQQQQQQQQMYTEWDIYWMRVVLEKKGATNDLETRMLVTNSFLTSWVYTIIGM